MLCTMASTPFAKATSASLIFLDSESSSANIFRNCICTQSYYVRISVSRVVQMLLQGKALKKSKEDTQGARIHAAYRYIYVSARMNSKETGRYNQKLRHHWTFVALLDHLHDRWVHCQHAGPLKTTHHTPSISLLMHFSSFSFQTGHHSRPATVL